MPRSPLKIREYTAEHLLGLVAAVEPLIPEPRLPRGARPRRAFRKAGTWLLEERYLEQVILRPGAWRRHQRLPEFIREPGAAGFSYLLWRRFAGRRITAPVHAQALRTKTNLRAWYTHPPECSLKIQLDHSIRRKSNFSNEIMTRLSLEGKGIHTPKIIRYQIEQPPFYVWEELIWGRRPHKRDDAHLICRELFPQLTSLYRHHGVTWQLAAQGFDRGRMYHSFCRALKLVPWQSHWPAAGQFRGFAKDILRQDAYWPVSLGHGDLSLKNLVITPQGKVQITDWEMAGEQPVALDLHRLVLQLPEAEPIVGQLMSELDSSGCPGAPLPFERQMFLAALAWVDEQMQRAQQWTEREGRDFRDGLSARLRQNGARLRPA
jgi:hypothetical protein